MTRLPGVVRALVVVASRSPVGLRRPIDRHGRAQIVLGEAGVDVALGVAPSSSFLEDPGAKADG